MADFDATDSNGNEVLQDTAAIVPGTGQSIDTLQGLGYTDTQIADMISQGNGTQSSMATVSPNPSVANPATTPTGTTSGSLVGPLSNLGLSIASMVTGRPIVSSGGVKTLASPSVVTGSVSASSMLLVIAGVAVVALVLIVGKE